MTKVRYLKVSLFCLAVLMGKGAVSAQTGGTSDPVPARRAREFSVLTSAATISTEEALGQILRSALRPGNAEQSTESRFDLSATLLSVTYVSSINSGALYQAGGNNNNQGGNNNNQGGNNNDPNWTKNKPLPEPSTLLSFAAAVVIGAGVLLLGRLRKERK
jgi:hypothetical protein